VAPASAARAEMIDASILRNTDWSAFQGPRGSKEILRSAVKLTGMAASGTSQPSIDVGPMPASGGNPDIEPRTGHLVVKRRPNPSLPLIGGKQPEIRFHHETARMSPPGSNPSTKHLADGAILPGGPVTRCDGQHWLVRRSR
jgi:hypothetical protein